MVTVNIGNEGFQARTRDVLESIATGPANTSVVEVNDFDGLSLAAEDVINAVCNSKYCL